MAPRARAARPLERHAGLLIVGKRGAGRPAGLLLGSISQELVTLARVPITVVP
jgi:nucleotide-binding universal stress UspA family protein